MYNHIAVWLYLIGTPERARRLRARLDNLKYPPLDPLFGVEPLQCPLTILFGAEASKAAYADNALRPALDLWDMEYITPSDMRRWCLEVEQGRYKGPVFNGRGLVTSRVYRGRLPSSQPSG